MSAGARENRGGGTEVGARIPPSTAPVPASKGLLAPAIALGQAATYLSLFLVYSNLAGIAVSHHHVPRGLAGALPLVLLAVPAILDVLRTRRIVLTPALPLVVLFFAVQVAGAAFSRDPAVSLGEARDTLFEGVGFYVLVTHAVRTRATLRGASWTLLAAGVLMAVVPLHQQVTGSFDREYGGLAQVEGLGFHTGEVEEGGEVVQRRLAGPIGEKNRYAQVMLMLLPLGLFRIWGERSRILRGAGLFVTALAMVGFALAFSRGGAVGLFILVAGMVGMRVVTLRQMGFVVVGVTLLFAALPQYWSRIATIGSAADFMTGEAGRTEEADGAMAGRLTEMLAAAHVFADHPVIGVGPGMFKEVSQHYGNQLGIRRLNEGRRAHSLYLELAAENGAFGLLAYLAAVALTLIGLDRVRRALAREDPELAGAATAYLLVLLVYLGTGIFLHMAYERYFFVVLGLAGSALHIGRGALQGRRDGVPATVRVA
ncbi:MAG TPA: O-antigen ligase family protein [Planctomycetota bacterium]|jgi:O-antigen ligase|nr:O-antigen ligase family protein [Planctomycetota bacterium]